jgi:hypothetical protein
VCLIGFQEWKKKKQYKTKQNNIRNNQFAGFSTSVGKSGTVIGSVRKEPGKSGT